jgi:hypothetical protein
MTIRRGAGTVIELGSNDNVGTATWVAMPSIRNFRMNGRSGEQEVTALDSTAKEFLRDLPDYGTASVEVFYRPDTATQNEISGLESLFNSGANRAFRVTPNGAAKRQSFVAFVMSRDITFDPNAPMTQSIELRITGPLTFTNV